jgi:hypothetical protein
LLSAVDQRGKMQPRRVASIQGSSQISNWHEQPIRHFAPPMKPCASSCGGGRCYLHDSANKRDQDRGTEKNEVQWRLWEALNWWIRLLVLAIADRVGAQECGCASRACRIRRFGSVGVGDAAEGVFLSIGRRNMEQEWRYASLIAVTREAGSKVVRMGGGIPARRCTHSLHRISDLPCKTAACARHTLTPPINPQLNPHQLSPRSPPAALRLPPTILVRGYPSSLILYSIEAAPPSQLNCTDTAVDHGNRFTMSPRLDMGRSEESCCGRVSSRAVDRNGVPRFRLGRGGMLWCVAAPFSFD